MYIYREEGGQNNAYATGNDDIDELWLREEERGVFLGESPFGAARPIATHDLDKTASSKFLQGVLCVPYPFA